MGPSRRRGACASLPACGPTDTQAGPPRWRGARASLWGCIAVNKQCFKLQAEGSQSAAAERLSERQGTRNGPEARPGVWQWRRIWTSQVIITQWAEIPRQETGAKHDQALAAHGRLGVWQGWSSREARIIHRRAGVHNGNVGVGRTHGAKNPSVASHGPKQEAQAKTRPEKSYVFKTLRSHPHKRIGGPDKVAPS